MYFPKEGKVHGQLIIGMKIYIVNRAMQISTVTLFICAEIGKHKKSDNTHVDVDLKQRELTASLLECQSARYNYFAAVCHLGKWNVCIHGFCISQQFHFLQCTGEILTLTCQETNIMIFRLALFINSKKVAMI